MAGISQGMYDVRGRARQGTIGTLVYNDHTIRRGNGLNTRGQAVNIWTVTVADPGDSTDITLSIDGTPITINTATGLSLAQVGAKLATAINAEPLVGGRVQASFDTATLTLTGLQMGVSFTPTESDGALSAVTETQAAAYAATIPFARAMIYIGYNPGGLISAPGESERLLATPVAAAFTAQVKTMTMTYVAGAVVQASVYEVRNGERILLAAPTIEVSATDATTTQTALVAGINAALPANTVLASGTTTPTFTAEVPGTEFDIEFAHLGPADTAVVFTVADTVPPSASTSLHRAWLGASLYSDSATAPYVAGPTNNSAGEYAANDGVVYLIRGCLWVESSETVSKGGQVYVETAAGATCGRFYAAASATRVALSRRIATWERDGLVAADTLAALRLEA